MNSIYTCRFFSFTQTQGNLQFVLLLFKQFKKNFVALSKLACRETRKEVFIQKIPIYTVLLQMNLILSEKTRKDESREGLKNTI